MKSVGEVEGDEYEVDIWLSPTRVGGVAVMTAAESSEG